MFEKEIEEYMKAAEQWYSSARLCMNCEWAEGIERNDQCTAYHMPLYFVKRKYKCKCFTEAQY